MDTSNQLLSGRPHGGLAILWRESISKRCSLIETNDPRLMAIEFEMENGNKLMLINVYLPYCSDTNLEDFIFYLSKIEMLVNDSVSPYVMVCGDFNAHIPKHGHTTHMFGGEFVKFTTDSGLTISDQAFLPNNTYTYVSEAHLTCSWLDHVVSTISAHNLIDKMYVEYGTVTSDHHPIVFHLNVGKVDVDINSCTDEQEVGDYGMRIKWDELSQEAIAKYTLLSKQELSKVFLNHQLLLCDDPLCTDPTHLSAIDRMYHDITSALKEASSDLCSSKQCANSYKQVLGWNTYCKELHSYARDAYLLWRDNGKPRIGFFYKNMSQTRAQFKLALRQCKSNSNKESANALANKLLSRTDKEFWKDVKKLNNKNGNVPTVSTINGATGISNILNMWQSHYKGLLNSSRDSSAKNDVLHTLGVSNYSFDRFTFDEMCDVIKCLKSGKSPGLDNIYGEHFKLADKSVHVYLTLLFNAVVIHGYIPLEIMNTVLVPIIKDKKGDITSKDNYRPIAITCILSKLLELLILSKIRDCIPSNSNQFGFKEKHGTDMCVYVLQQIVEYYTSQSSPVYACFLDASKAFDKVNHWHLFYKLIKANVPVIFVRLLYVWYTTQNFCVKWGQKLSASFMVINGVRQGSILSPILFNFYLEDLSNELHDLKVGCHISDICCNHLFYADDCVLIAPSPNALQKLLNCCQKFADKNELVYNEKKTKCMVFKPNGFYDLHIPKFYLNNSMLNLVDKEKYLGVIVTEDQKDDCDIKRQIRSIYSRGNILIRRFKHCSDDVKLKLFRSYCNSLYCAQLWCQFKCETVRKLQTAYNRVFRNLMKLKQDISISAYCTTSNIDTLTVIWRKLIFSFRKRVLESNNTLISAIVNSLMFLDSRITRVWCKKLFTF